jgi:hypothetical protein
VQTWERVYRVSWMWMYRPSPRQTRGGI